MSHTICKLCLFKSEPMDEICIEENKQLQEIVDEIFNKMVTLTKVDLYTVCTMCREKLKSFYDYYKFVLNNQMLFKEVPTQPDDALQFIEVKKELDVLDHVEVKIEQPDPAADFTEEEEDDEKPIETKKRKRVQKPRSHVIALQKQQSALMAILFDFKCDYCGLHCSTYRAIYNHCKTAHKKTKTWTCCDKKEMTRDIELIEHVMEHKQAWKCEPCSRDFKDVLELWFHRNEQHSEPSKIEIQNPAAWLKLQYRCELCGEMFRTRGLIERHMKDAHIRKFICDICGAAFYDRVESAKHRRTEHSSILRVPCPICGVMIKNKISLVNSHIKNLHKNQSMICPCCGKVCNNDRIYRTHMMRAHKPPKHECSYCQKKFKTKVQCADHEAIHTKIPRYECPICSAQFKSQGNFTAHKRKLHPLEHERQKQEREAKRYKLE